MQSQIHRLHAENAELKDKLAAMAADLDTAAAHDAPHAHAPMAAPVPAPATGAPNIIVNNEEGEVHFHFHGATPQQHAPHAPAAPKGISLGVPGPAGPSGPSKLRIGPGPVGPDSAGPSGPTKAKPKKAKKAKEPKAEATPKKINDDEPLAGRAAAPVGDFVQVLLGQF
jgi:hypothetical protein